MDSQIDDLTQHSSHETGGSSSKDNLRGRFEVVHVKCLLRPSVRLLLEMLTEEYQEMQLHMKQVDDAIQKLVHPQDFEHLSNWEIPKNIAGNIVKLMDLVDQSRPYEMLGHISPEQVVRFIDSTILDLQLSYNDEYPEKEDPTDPFIYTKKKISDNHDELQFVRNILWIIGNPLTEHDEDLLKPFHYARRLAVMFSFIFCCCFVFLVDENEDVNKFLSGLKEEVFPDIINDIHTIVKEFYNHYRSRELSVLRNDNRTPANMIDKQVVSFFDCLINKLRMHMSSDDKKAAGFMVEPVKDQMETAVNELSFLRLNLLDILQVYSQSQEGSAVKEMESLTLSTLALILETGYQIYFSQPHGKEEEEEDGIEEKANYWSLHLPDLLEAVDSLRQQASDLYSNHKFFSSSTLEKLSCRPSTSTNHMESVDFLIKNLEELMDHHAASIIPLMHQFETLLQEVVSMRNCLMSEIVDMGKPENEFLVVQVEQVTNRSCLIIDTYASGEGPLWYHMLGMFVATNDIKMTSKEMKSVLEKMKTSATNNVRIISSSTAVNSKDNMENAILMEEATCDELVGVKDAATEVIELLTERATRLKTLSIVGMPGIGKTTLANSVYKHPSINIHFHVRAWCCVSQVYERETLLAEILSQTVGKTKPTDGKVRDEDCAPKLYQSLKGRRYLIVMDDLWDVEVWNGLKNIFPDDHNGSRILFTTRYGHFALKANSVRYDLRLLSNEESCELLWSKIFDRETCPPELSIVSKRVARNCKGLPLALVLMAGILKRTERRKDSWEKVAAEVKRLHGMEITNILELSYKHLPVWLRPCFLYFGEIPENTSIPVSKLIRLWASTGFVQQIFLCQKSLEEEAKSYLDELIDRSLIMISKRSSSGGVKACCAHDVLRGFCSEKLQQEKFMWQESMFGGIICLQGEIGTQILSLKYYNRSNRAPNIGKFYRAEDYINWHFGQRISERGVFQDKLTIGRAQNSERAGGGRASQTEPLSYSFIAQHKFLTTLDLGNVRVESSADTWDLIKLVELVHLRYLAIRPRTTQIPSEIGNLQNLETLIITGVIGYIMLPDSLWNLFNLRNVLMDDGFFNFQLCSRKFIENFPQLDNLKSLSTLALRHENDVEKFVLRTLPGIQKLGCKFFADSWDDSTGCSIFPELDFLSELKSLKVFFSGKVRSPCKFSFPSNLRKLSLSNSRLPWDEISVIGRQLPNLEVLKLLNKAFEGQQWDMRDGEFQKLKYLKLDSLDIEVWDANAEHLPCLEQLIVLTCPQLEEIPSSFGEISTLQLIEMKWCSSSAMDSVKQILEYQRDLSNYQFTVTLVGLAEV